MTQKVEMKLSIYAQKLLQTGEQWQMVQYSTNSRTPSTFHQLR